MLAGCKRARLTATPLSHRGVEAEGVAGANRVHPVPLPLKMQWLALGQDWLTQDANRVYIEARLRAEAWWDDAYDANMDEAGAVTEVRQASRSFERSL